MIQRQSLLSDLQRTLRQLEADLRQRCDELPDVSAALRTEYDAAKEAQRTAESFEEWRAGTITQVAAAWVLSCVFARFLEDNQLVDPPRISGPGERLRRARDEYEIYFRKHPQHTYRDYLLDVFDRLGELPGGREIFGRHNPIHQQRGWPSGDAARTLLEFFQRIEPTTGELVHDFTDESWDTRFLGDLYQDLSEDARKKYALLQTPEFVEEFILDRTLEPAIDEFGLDGSGQRSAVSGQQDRLKADKLTAESFFKMIDPACGSGHFLLGSFRRLFERWQKAEPGTNSRVLAQRALASVHGVDINPYAVAIARFRLLLAALRSCGIGRLADPFEINLACGDSLLHGTPGGDQLVLGFDPLAHAYQSEDLAELRRILKTGHYHAVVANPPYITPKDRSLNQAYRQRYSACHGKYALTVPFMQRLFDLAVDGNGQGGRGAGYVGQITSNSFMKREFGKKLIESFFPRIDLTHVIDTSGAYIPGHGTPTAILFGRNCQPRGTKIRAAMGIRGEPATPDDPACGFVWSAIVRQIDQPGSQSQFISVDDSPRENFHKHPWSIGGGGAAELKEQLESEVPTCLGNVVSEIGRSTHTGEDEAFYMSRAAAQTLCIRTTVVPVIMGELVRDFCIAEGVLVTIFPYDKVTGDPIEIRSVQLRRHFWRFRTNLRQRKDYGRTVEERGFRWFDHTMFFPRRYRLPLSISMAEIATHNHFALDRGGKVFDRTAPVIKLPAGTSEDDHLALVGLLNSSTACFWMKQVCHNKGSTVDQHHARQRTAAFEDFYAFNGTSVGKLPLSEERPLALARRLDETARVWVEVSPSAILRSSAAEHSTQLVAERQSQWEATRQQMIALQEELDWQCYRLYGLTEDELTCGGTPPAIELGQRAFEIVLARKMAAGELETTWFERHGSTPITEIPDDWPEDYKRLVERRIELIENDRNIGLIEQPEYKRRWNTEPWESQLERALKNWLLDRLESYFDFDGRMAEAVGDQQSAVSQKKADCRSLIAESSMASAEAVSDQRSAVSRQQSAVSQKKADSRSLIAESSMASAARIADTASRDSDFMQVAELYRGRKDFDVGRLVAELVEDESVPLLPVLRYKPAAMDKRRAWERTWELQRQEDELSDQQSAVSDQLAAAREELSAVSGQQSAKLEAECKTLEAQLEKLTAECRKLTASIPVPPKYSSSDFQKSSYWRLRGKLDVPKERWVSFPHCEGEDGSMVIAWAGYDHLGLTQAIGTYYAEVKEKGGSRDPRLAPLLACILELVPWLKQWHNDIDPTYNLRMGDYYESFVEGEARELDMTVGQIRDWQPPKNARRRRRG